jgi:putative ABC transport system permease protein
MRTSAGFTKQSKRQGKLFLIFSCLAIFIACLGLFGLASFNAMQRTKEIGIRKVLGASVPGVVGLLSREFLILVAVSNLIAWPIAWYFMDKWLQDFAYKISISVWVFIAAGTLALLIALFTVAFQAIKTAVSNPIHALKYE